MASSPRRPLRAGAAALLAAAALVGLAGTARADGSGTINDPWNPTRAAHITCDTATLFANYSAGGGHRDPIATLHKGNYIGVRYITSNNYSADVFWHGTSKWGFVLRDCFTLN
ncbi:hypothetical protein ACOBQX_24760 [Actinokineospora sp. G85]|uniref:hypothetical protein n=1 Tax=Actinokineospora sp. G85 TaxID=3406626 RepID=UPI003C70BF6E